MADMKVRAPPSSSYSLETAAVILEQAQHLAFSGDHPAALELLRTTPDRTPQLELWLAMMHLFTGRHDVASSLLTALLARGYRGALGPLATLHRLRGDGREYLESLTPAETETLDGFEAVMLQREIGAWFLELERFHDARPWLETAWRNALVTPLGYAQRSSVATPLANVLARLGFDARAVSVLDEGLRHCNRHRRTPLLYERALRNLHLGRLEAVEDDLAELESCAPNGDPDWGPLVRYLRARYLHALGVTAEARGEFELCFAFAANGSSHIARDTAFHAAL
jgi:hypothetical protein